jgi:DNA modification methylase
MAGGLTPGIVVRGDARRLPLPDASVDLIITSPPYFGLRSYTDGGEHYGGQIGAEASPAEYVAELLDCTREWMRVLKPAGSMFVNLGDKYSGYTNGQGKGRNVGGGERTTARVPDGPVSAPAVYGIPNKSLMGLPWRYALACTDQLGLILRAEIIWAKPNGLPESVTDRVRRSHEQLFHFVRQPRYYAAVDEIREATADIGRKGKTQKAGPLIGSHGSAGHDSNGMRMAEAYNNPLGKLPSSVWEIDEESGLVRSVLSAIHTGSLTVDEGERILTGARRPPPPEPGSVWEIPSAPLKVPPRLGLDHFAAFPPALVRPVVLGWSPPGICTACGEGRRPVTAAVALDMNRPQARRAQALADAAGLTEDHLAALLSVGVSDTGRGKATQTGTGRNTPEVYALAAVARAALGGYAREYLLRRPTGFSYACACPVPDAPTRPSVVLDPFGGTGTTALVATVHGRTGITIDMSADYSRLAQWRTTDPGERCRVIGAPRPPPQSDGQHALFD